MYKIEIGKIRTKTSFEFITVNRIINNGKLV